MIIEHVFITTLDAPDALRVASDYLTGGGFAVRNETAFAMGTPWTKLDVSRGKSSAARAKAIDELPQRLWLEWDRGRVTVAASIEYYQTSTFTYGSRKEPPPQSPKLRPHVELMHALVGGLEAALARGVPVDEARRQWADVEARLRADSLRKRRRRNITLWSVLGVIVLLIATIIFLATRR